MNQIDKVQEKKFIENKENQAPRDSQYFSKASHNKKSLKYNTLQRSTRINNNASSQNMQSLSFLALEYKLSLEYGPSLGIYIVPDIDDFFIWRFVIFLRNGYYKNTQVKGIIQFSKIKHQCIEKVSLKNDIYHSLINSKTGALDFEKLIQIVYKNTSNAASCLNQGIFLFIKSLKQMFFDPQILKCKDSYNPAAGKLFSQNPQKFIQKVYRHILKDREEEKILIQNWLCQNTNNKNKKNLTLFKEEEVKQIQKQLKEFCLLQKQNEEKSIQQKADEFFQYLMQI